MTTLDTAVRRCVKAYYDACDIEDPKYTGLNPAALDRVHLAYRHAMPYLLPDPDSIDAFIACVTHGLVIQVFQPAEASKLLYAAQVALGSLRTRNEAKSKSQPQQADTPTPSPLEGGEAAIGRTAGAAANPVLVPREDPSNPQPSRAPSLGTVSSSPRVGDHESQPREPGAAAPPAPTPLPQSQSAAKPQLAAPQVPQVPGDALPLAS
jgi:hypothetical protein